MGTKLGILIYVYIIIMIQFTDDAGMRDGEERKRRCLSGEFRIGEKHYTYIHTYIYYIVSKASSSDILYGSTRPDVTIKGKKEERGKEE